MNIDAIRIERILAETGATKSALAKKCGLCD